ncbi:hypothetical protein [Sinorhizobium meliloti]|uniref:hypothetical protein n=1 Tax=Rhizobium meliloti TaxID=382 RepID=UPI000FD7A2EC|nr:hypothetical protein [Sinorhizobium meliloti]RVG71054.1 hypothetical protein CN223_30470 [Sinorhizobium meliloti]
MAINHFYIYNECRVSIKSTVVYFSPEGEQHNTEIIAPGFQKMMCATESNLVRTESHGAEGTLNWRVLDLNITGEYTHVIACHCHGGGCPPEWPNASSRQQPD